MVLKHKSILFLMSMIIGQEEVRKGPYQESGVWTDDDAEQVAALEEWEVKVLYLCTVLIMQAAIIGSR